ncbi:6-bladed beta-propeller [bacterium]|nr:6-bladed beta-propeller [bacterium]
MRASLILTALLLASIPAAAGPWQGSLDQRDGTTIVGNPEVPAEGAAVLDLRELWRLGEDDEEVFFGVIAQMLHDDEGNIYLLDGQLSEIQVFDAAGEYLRTIGRRGEGPGEFMNAADMCWAPGGQLGVVQAWPGKIVMITPEGDPGSMYGLPFRSGGGFQSVSRAVGVGETMVIAGTAWTREGEQELQLTYLKAYDAEGGEIASYHEGSAPAQFGGYEFVEEDYVDFQRRWAAAPDGRVAAALSFGDYRIHVWNGDGTLDRIIERPGYRDVPRTSDEKALFQTMYEQFTRWNPGSSFRASDRHQAVGQLFFRDDGSLWVQSGQSRWRPAEGLFTSFDVYDREGRFVQRVDLKADADARNDGLFFAGDRAYVVTDLFDAMLASFGTSGGEAAALDAEPVTVIAYEFAPARLARN